MRGSVWVRDLLAAAALFVAACSPYDLPDGASKLPPDVTTALGALPEVEVVQTTKDGLPTALRGDLGRVDPARLADRATAEASLRPAIAPALLALRIGPDNVQLRNLNHDGTRVHARYQTTVNGIRVVGGDLVIHIDQKGTIYAINGTARGDLPVAEHDIGARVAETDVEGDARYANMHHAAAQRAFLITADEQMFDTYEIIVDGMRGRDPFRDKVFVDADSGQIVAVHPQIYFAENRKVYSANHGSSLPGTLQRSEGEAGGTDIDVDAAYDGTGDTYEAYQAFWSRDSYNNAGAQLTSTVHYSNNYCNAFWDGTQMVYGDGDPSQNCLPLARGVDVTAHELTHAVTENESGLIYSGESGGLNEALSDIFGAFTEAWTDGGKTGPLAVSSDTWLVGEDVLPPYLRNMSDPAADGASKDYWTSSVGNVDVHYSSGIANLAFYLLSQGGQHPRGKSPTVVVEGIGMDHAIRIFYYANTNLLTSSSNFLSARNMTMQAATDLGYSAAEHDAVQNAWAAVGVGTAVGGGTGSGSGSGSGSGTGITVLQNNVAVTGISGALQSQAYYSLDVPAGQTNLAFTTSGGTGDADLYVQQGSLPTLTSYQCRPYITGNNETCAFTAPAAGTWYVMLNGYTAYSNTSLKGAYSVSTGDGVTVLVNGKPVTPISGGTGSNRYWKIQTPAGKHLTVRISGGTGDADLYTRFNAKPTTTTFGCRPYLFGNNETCSVSSTQAGWYYIMIRGYTSYSGVTLNGTF